MLIGGLQKFSLLDYPNKIAAIVFTQGCYFRCRYCHNPSLIEKKSKNIINENDFFSFLEIRKNKLDAVVITGGEPTIHKDLKDFIRKIKDLNFLVKLDTSGINPTILEELINENLLNYIAMDIKASFENYKKITRKDIDINKIKKSISIIINSKIDHEFRTTLVDNLHIVDEVENIVESLKGAKRYILQRFRPKITLDPTLKSYNTFSDDVFNNLKTILSKEIKEVLIR
jgi:pyruvate formate lyase activating enzyme